MIWRDLTPDKFRETLLIVIGQPLQAAGYVAVENQMQWQAGLFRFRRRIDDGSLLVDYQLLLHAETLPRYHVRLARKTTGVQMPSADITLARLLWDVFAVRVLPAPDHWWQVHGLRSLGDGLLESGKLLVAYGLPWLDGTLTPDDST